MVFEANGDIYLYSLDDFSGGRFKDHESYENVWYTPSLSNGYVAAKRTVSDTAFEVAVFDLNGDEVVAWHEPMNRARHALNFAELELELNGDYLAYLRPVSESSDVWEVVEVRLGLDLEAPCPHEVVVGSGSFLSEFSLDETGSIAASFTESSSWGKTAIDLYSPDFFNALERGEALASLEYGPGYRVRGIHKDRNKVIYELDEIAAPFGAALVTGIALTEFPDDGSEPSTSLLAGQLIPGHEIIYSRPQAVDAYVSWFDGSIDQEYPAIAVRIRYENSNGVPEGEIDLAIYPEENERIKNTSCFLAGLFLW